MVFANVADIKLQFFGIFRLHLENVRTPGVKKNVEQSICKKKTNYTIAYNTSHFCRSLLKQQSSLPSGNTVRWPIRHQKASEYILETRPKLFEDLQKAHILGIHSSRS